MKKSKKEVNYTEFGLSDYMCSKCRHWGMDSRCDEVKGKVDPHGSCSLFREPAEIENARGVDALENM